MRYREKLNIVIIRDNGPRRSFYLKRSNFILLFIFFACMPFIALALSCQCWVLWRENGQMRDALDRIERDCQTAEARAERLENLEDLLKEENIPGRELLLRQIAARGGAAPPEDADSRAPAAEEQAEGPGHEDFPVLDSGRVGVDNVQARLARGNSIRIALDLRNPENEPPLAGEVEATLVTADGERTALAFTDRDAGAFRINRFKRAVVSARLPRGLGARDAQIILQVTDQDRKPIYRNIFAVQR